MNSSTLPEMTAQWQETLSWQPDAMQQATFELLYQEMIRVNSQFNLTRITEPTEFWEKHLWDSLRGISPWLQTVADSPWECLDIGTGGGFPGLPIAIVRPDWRVTLLDSTRKKITFIEQMIDRLGLSNAGGIVDRVEQLGHNSSHREAYDLATIRAVASASVCAEYAMPMIKVGGKAILYRGQWSEEEDQALKTVVEQLGSAVELVERFTTPLSRSARTCIVLSKIKSVGSEFPRPIGLAVQAPLV
jgi:16S rRNA (guanine527-N7)-methyltransferase